jgi:hypothetical protein
VTCHSAEWFNNYELLQPDVSDVGHLSATSTGLETQRRIIVSKTECSVVGDKTQLAHGVEDIIGYF